MCTFPALISLRDWSCSEEMPCCFNTSREIPLRWRERRTQVEMRGGSGGGVGGRCAKAQGSEESMMPTRVSYSWNDCLVLFLVSSPRFSLCKACTPDSAHFSRCIPYSECGNHSAVHRVAAWGGAGAAAAWRKDPKREWMCYLYNALPPMVARLENTLKSVMLSGQDWMFRKPRGDRRRGKDKVKTLRACSARQVDGLNAICTWTQTEAIKATAAGTGTVHILVHFMRLLTSESFNGLNK